MPLYDADGNLFTGRATVAGLDEPPVPTFGQTLGAAFRSGNTIGSYLSNNAGFNPADPAGHFAPEPGFNPMDHIKGTVFEDDPGLAAGALSMPEFQAIQRQEESRRADQDIMAKSGMSGVVAGVATQVLEPINWMLPGGEIVGGARLGTAFLRSAGRAAVAGAAASAIQEGALHLTQPGRTMEESTANVASAAILSGILGAGSALLRPGEHAALTAKLDQDRQTIAETAAGSDPLPAGDSDAATSAPARGPAMPASVGAASSDNRDLVLQDFFLNKIPGVKNLIAGMDPIMRTFSGQLVSAKKAMADLAETSLQFTMNKPEIDAAGNIVREAIPTTQGPAIDRIVRNTVDATTAVGDQELTRLYMAYRYNKTDVGVIGGMLGRDRAAIAGLRGTAPDMMSPSQFEEAVGDALMSGDKHDNPHVQQAAEFLRNTVYDPWWNRAKDDPATRAAFGIPEDADQKTAQSYFMRVWNHERIRAKRPELQNTITDWLESEQAAKAQSQERLRTLHSQLGTVQEQAGKLGGRARTAEARASELEAAAGERGMEVDRTGTRAAETVDQAASRSEALDLAGFDQATQILSGTLTDAKAQAGIGRLRERLSTVKQAEAKAAEAERGAGANRSRADVLEQRRIANELKQELLEAAHQTADEHIAGLREQIEAELKAWRGRSADDARAALRSREEAGRVRGLKQEADIYTGSGARLTSADRAVDKTVLKILASDRDMPRIELHNRAGQIIDRILGTPDGRLAYDAPSGGPKIGGVPSGSEPRGPLASRSFMIPDHLIKEFLDRDARANMRSYLRSMVPDIIMTERFGDVDMTSAFKKIRDEHDALANNPNITEKQRIKLAHEYDTAVADLAAVRDRVRGVFGSDPKLRQFGRLARNANRLTSMALRGGSTLNSIPDAAGIVFQHGFMKVAGGSWHPFFKSMLGLSEAYKKAAPQYRAMGIALDTRLNARSNDVFDAIDTYKPHGVIERTLHVASDRFELLNFQAPWTDINKLAAAAVTGNGILTAAKSAAAGKFNSRDLERLAASGIDRHMAARIWEQAGPTGEVVDGVHLPNTHDWQDMQARTAFEGAVAREVDIAVITPGQEKPLWLSNPVGATLGQFQTFTHGATHRVLIANLQRRDAQSLQGLMAMTAAGMMSYALYSVSTGKALSTDPRDWVREGISRAGVLGWLEAANTFTSKLTSGEADVYRLLGSDRPLSKYESRSPLGALLGPTAGNVEKIYKAAQAGLTFRDGEPQFSRRNLHDLRTVMPLNNLVGFRKIVDLIDPGAESASALH